MDHHGITGTPLPAASTQVAVPGTATKAAFLKVLQEIRSLRAVIVHNAPPVSSSQLAVVTEVADRLRGERNAAYGQIRALEANNHRLLRQILRLRKTVLNKHLFRGWHVVGVSAHAVILRNAAGTLEILRPGTVFHDVRITAIDARAASIVTAQGMIPLPLTASP